ncbi:MULTISPECIES: hypothetical protein [unclassified Ruegeria]|uniref:hypothetical protein n=1 Tax=unclassified Ruegeria TaxID=2625375 RepID=UPI001C2B903E|nr:MULTISPECIES: hypothetical protein [unclassified Ruegeria]
MSILILYTPNTVIFWCPGSGCIVQSYTTSFEGDMEGTLVAHGIQAMGIIKAVGLRVKAWFGLTSGIGLIGGGHA